MASSRSPLTTDPASNCSSLSIPNSPTPLLMVKTRPSMHQDASTEQKQQQKKDNEKKLLSYLPATTGLQLQQPTDIKIENHIGYTAVPVGLVGPLTIKGDHQDATVHAAMATTEATLVASCSRGCKAFQAGGGIKALASREGMSRCPVFCFHTVDDAVKFWRKLPDFETELRAAAHSTSRFAKLTTIKPHIIGQEVHVKFVYTCGDASGQNMTTIATHKACDDLIRSHGEHLRVSGFFIEASMSGDKNFSTRSDGEPRGVEVMAWGVVSDETCRRVLGSSTEALYKGAHTSEMASIRTGILGHNANTANIIAALFIATGQDAASVLESGWTQLTTSYNSETKDLTLTLFMPNLVVGSVGGGTPYVTQAEALDLIGCKGQGRKWALAETICAFALALDISTMAAICNDTFSQGHARMARLVKM